MTNCKTDQAAFYKMWVYVLITVFALQNIFIVLQADTLRGVFAEPRGGLYTNNELSLCDQCVLVY